jgi:hypothetical protein
MGWGTPDTYYQPEKFGLSIVAETDQSGSYEFDMFVVWQDVNGNYYWATDSGCSCPSPFENHTSVAHLTADSASDIMREYSNWYDERYFKYESSHSEMLAKLMAL